MKRTDKKYLFISVRPEFAERIITKQKKIELRKVRPNVSPGDSIIIYASAPVKSVLAIARIKSIHEYSPDEMWMRYNPVLGIDKCRYDKYYQGQERAIGIEMESVKAISPITLNQLKSIYPFFQPPQIYRYIYRHQIDLERL